MENWVADERVNVSVVVPTYRRPGPLAWTLTSVLGQWVENGQVGRARLVIINNEADGGAVERAIEKAVARVGRGGWEIRVVHRDPPMYPVYSWYEGIREYTDPGDVVFLNGDDDMMLQNSIALRLRMMAAGGWDMLITAAVPYFMFTGPPGAEEVKVLTHGGHERWPACEWREPRTLTGAGLNDVCAIFISNHAYRNTPAFWDAYRRTIDLMRCIPAGGDDKFAMLPQFLPLPLLEAGKVGATEMFACIRGQSAYEITGSRGGKIAWTRPGYYYASCLYVFDRALGERADLAGLRRAYRGLTQRNYAPSRKMPDFRETISELGVTGWGAGLGGQYRILRSWGDVMLGRLGLNALSLRRRLAKQRPTQYDEFFAEA